MFQTTNQICFHDVSRISNSNYLYMICDCDFWALILRSSCKQVRLLLFHLRHTDMKSCLRIMLP